MAQGSQFNRFARRTFTTIVQHAPIVAVAHRQQKTGFRLSTNSLRLTTSRLELVATTAEIARWVWTDRRRLGDYLKTEIPRLWPPEDQVGLFQYFAAELQREPQHAGWYQWLWVWNVPPEKRLLVGNGGFKGPPDEQGEVELGYSVWEPFQRRGLATEAATALVDWAWQQPACRTVMAETDLHNIASHRVLQKLGFRYVGPVPETMLLRFEQSR